MLLWGGCCTSVCPAPGPWHRCLSAHLTLGPQIVHRHHSSCLLLILCELQSFVLSPMDEGVTAHTPTVFAEQHSHLPGTARTSPPFTHKPGPPLCDRGDAGVSSHMGPSPCYGLETQHSPTKTSLLCFLLADLSCCVTKLDVFVPCQ